MKYQKKTLFHKSCSDTQFVDPDCHFSYQPYFFFGIFSYRTGIQQIKENNISSLNVYATTLQTEMKKLEDFTKDICYSDTSYHLLSTNYYTSSQKILYEGTLRKMLQSEVSPYSGLLVFSDTAATSMYQYGSYFPNTYAKHCYELKEELKKILS